MPAEQLFTACSSHSSITADTAWQTSENAHANKPRIRLTRLSSCFLQLSGKVSSHFCKKTGRQLLPSTGLARCSSPASSAPVSSLSGHLVFSAPLWKGLYCSYHWLGHDKEVLLRLVEQQVSTHHAVHLDGYWSIGVCLSLGSQVHLQESHSCEQAKHHHSWGCLFYNMNKLELLLCARVLSPTRTSVQWLQPREAHAQKYLSKPCRMHQPCCWLSAVVNKANVTTFGAFTFSTCSTGWEETIW